MYVAKWLDYYHLTQPEVGTIGNIIRNVFGKILWNQIIEELASYAGNHFHNFFFSFFDMAVTVW